MICPPCEHATLPCHPPLNSPAPIFSAAAATRPHTRCSWYNHLDPAIKRGPWTEEEDQQIIELQHNLGNKWAEIAIQIVGRCVPARARWEGA